MNTLFTGSLLGLTILLAVSTEAQIPNASFESWTLGVPDGWYTNNDDNFAPVLQSDDAFEGLASILFSAENMTGGFASANLFPQTEEVEGLDGWLKPSLSGEDVLIASSELLQQDGFTVSSGVLTVDTSSDQWVNFYVPMTTVSQETVAFATITFEVFNPDGDPSNETEILIDELTYGPITKIEESRNRELLIEKVFPNPANQLAMLQYALPVSGFIEISVLNLSGQKVMTVLNNHVIRGHYRAEISCDQLESGIYVIELNDGNQSLFSKLMVEH
jgi:hypothetical protein